MTHTHPAKNGPAPFFLALKPELFIYQIII